MPYIPEVDRKRFRENNAGPESAGELNYIITTVIKFYLAKNGTSYKTMNDIVGALESAKLEFYRRVVVPYEDTKIETNGDVY